LRDEPTSSRFQIHRDERSAHDEDPHGEERQANGSCDGVPEREEQDPKNDKGSGSAGGNGFYAAGHFGQGNGVHNHFCYGIHCLVHGRMHPPIEMSQNKPHAGAHTRVEFLRLAWNFGGKTEKSFAILVAAAPVVLVGLLTVLVTHGFLSGARAGEYVISGVILLLLAASWIFYSPSILRPLNSTRVIRGLLETNASSDPERAYLAELLRYKDTWGKNGEIAGDVAIGYVHATIYYSLCVAYLVVVLAFYPRWGEIALGLFAAAALWMGILGFVLSLRRAERELRSTEQLGFQLRPNNPGIPLHGKTPPHR
jgi:hypothetical protein